MATELKLRRGTTSQHSSFTGAEAEVTVDTDKNTVVVHDGSTAGGYPLVQGSIGTAADEVPTNADLRVDTLADLQALDTAGARSVQMLGRSSVGDGGEGYLYWQSGDFSTEVANDEVTAGEGDGGIYLAPSSDKTGASGAWVRLHMGAINLRWYGAVGDASADDTATIDAWLRAIDGNTGYIPAGVYRYVGSFDWPEGVNVYGDGTPKIATFPQKGGDKDFLRPGYKDQLAGSVLLFDGTATKTRSTVRSDRFSNPAYCTGYFGRRPPSLVDFAIIQNMDVRDAGGNLTTASTDNRASSYEVGLATEATLGDYRGLNIFGYFDAAGVWIHSGDNDGDTLNPDYNTFMACTIASGVAITGHDAAAGDGPANTGQRFVGSGIYGYDHHNRDDSNPNIPTVFIDGVVPGTIGKIRGHSFSGCNFRTYSNDSIVFDYADDIMIHGGTYEFPSLSGVTGLDASGGFVGTANTGDVNVLGGASTSQPRIDEFIANTGGHWVFSFGYFDGFMVGYGPNGVRVGGSGASGDSIIQATDDFSTVNSKWKIRRNTEENDRLDFFFDGDRVCYLTRNGTIQPQKYGTFEGDTTGTFTPGFNFASANMITAEGRYRRFGDVVYFDILMEFDSLDTSDTSTISIGQSGLPSGLSKAGIGNVTLAWRESTAITGSPGQAIYPTFNDSVTVSFQFVDADRSEYAYDSGIIAGSGRVALAGWFFQS